MPVGRVRFAVVNRGDVAHDFADRRPRRRDARSRAGSASLEVTFTQCRAFAYRCTVPGHAALGMKGVLTVGTPEPPRRRRRPATHDRAAVRRPRQRLGRAKLTKIGDFERPVYVTAPLGDPNRARSSSSSAGTIQEVVDGQLLPTPFLDITDQRARR